MFFKAKSTDEQPFSGKTRLWLILAGAAIGVILLIIGGGDLLIGKEKKEEQPTEITPQEELKQYRSYLEERIRTLCESVGGVGNVTVAVTLSGNFEEIYATEQINGNEEYVIIGSGANASALHISRATPEIAGIGIVCSGADNADIRRELTSLICAAFRIPSNRIYIATAKNTHNSV